MTIRFGQREIKKWYSPRVEAEAGLLLDHLAQLGQPLNDLADEQRPQPHSVVEEVVEGVTEAGLVQFAAPVLVLLHELVMARLVHLHAAETHAQRGGRAGRTLGHLLVALLHRRIVPVLSRAHLQVQNARLLELRRYVLQHQIICKRRGGGWVVVVHPGRVSGRLLWVDCGFSVHSLVCFAVQAKAER